MIPEHHQTLCADDWVAAIAVVPSCEEHPPPFENGIPLRNEGNWKCGQRSPWETAETQVWGEEPNNETVVCPRRFYEVPRNIEI